ncbi:hypothetical protein OSB04_022425 [Centaurea solstitialis]|uniref:Uncharacterized protein n=1 Tax=Centaurea solstitialis TaxID=347529 RepID=A0AA38TEH8_9ASTR|nr:hypothetical protein OSB04_022425 [Centaurea solstitialis]
MSSYDYSPEGCVEMLYNLGSARYPFENQYNVNISSDDLFRIDHACTVEGFVRAQDGYSRPMVWIGIYIAIASSFCILAMGADLLHGFRKRKLWIPCKYFSLNTVSITVIAIAMKLPVDLGTPMLGDIDQLAKVGSMAFMCTMMANFMPSLASMDGKALLANVTGLAILVITIAVNIYIEIQTGVIRPDSFTFSINKYTIIDPHFMVVSQIYAAMILFLLLISISLAIMIPTTKQILEFKYQTNNKATSNDQFLQHTQMSTLEKLKQQVGRYWVMAETGSPQFVMVSNPLSTTSGVICIIGLLMYIVLVLQVFSISVEPVRYKSEYKWSLIVVLTTQSIGVLVGSIAPIFRCFVGLSFKSYTKWNLNHFAVFKVEKYWTQKLYEWKESHIPFLSSGRRSRILVHNLKTQVIKFCLGFQKVIVVACKILGLIPIVVLNFVVYCLYCWESLKEMLFNPPIASSTNDTNEGFHNYVLHLEDKMELAEKALKRISNSMNHLIQKAEMEQPSDLLKLLENSTQLFKGVESFDTDQIPPLVFVDVPNSWSLTVVTLTCISIALPNTRYEKVKSLCNSVGEGLSYTRLVEESFNTTGEYVNIQRSSMTLWHEVEDHCKWLENTLERSAYKGKTSIDILKWFADKAKETVIEINESMNGQYVENFPHKLIVANAMYRITQTILLNDQSNIKPISEEELFALLSCMIADILCACLTNIPRVITTKCQESVIEKREASVEVAAKLLGRSTEIIKKLETCRLPCMDPDKMAFIDEWRLHLKHTIVEVISWGSMDALQNRRASVTKISVIDPWLPGLETPRQQAELPRFRAGLRAGLRPTWISRVPEWISHIAGTL